MWTVLEMVALNEDKHKCDVAYMWNLKKWYKLTYLQNRNSHRCRKQAYGYQGVMGEGRDKLGDWNWHTHTTIYKIDHCAVR